MITRSDLLHPGLDSRRGWLMAALAFVTCLVDFGIVYSFGAFFKPIRRGRSLLDLVVTLQEPASLSVGLDWSCIAALQRGWVKTLALEPSPHYPPGEKPLSEWPVETLILRGF